jgi:hypothetical protein
LTLDRPNVIIFFTDRQRWDTVSLHGNALGHKLDEASRWRRKLQITTSAGSKKCSADIGLTKVAKREKNRAPPGLQDSCINPVRLGWGSLTL